MNLFEISLITLSNSIAEPVSCITDIILAGVSYYFFVRLRYLKNSAIAEKHWASFFLFFGHSTFSGGLAHAICDRISNPAYDLVWLSMQLFSGAAVFYALNAAIRSEIKHKGQQKYFLLATNIQLLIFLPCVFYFMHFKVVEVNLFISLVALLYIYIISFQTNWVHRALIGLGFLISGFTVYVHYKKVSLAWWFNHNDIAHVIMYLSLILIYKGVKYKIMSDSLFKYK
jgi:hypothetical protein